MIAENSSGVVRLNSGAAAANALQSASSDPELVEMQWVFRKNCSLSPRQLLAWYLSLCAITLVIAGGFWLAGYWIVLPFAGLELSLVALAFVIYARHAADYEMVQLNRYQLKITSASGSKLTEIVLSPQWVRLDYDGKYKAPLMLSHQGEKIKFGRYIAERDKPSMHKELRAALVKAACGAL
jgi:uncharacterized membrane protein